MGQAKCAHSLEETWLDESDVDNRTSVLMSSRQYPVIEVRRGPKVIFGSCKFRQLFCTEVLVPAKTIYG